MMKRAEFLRRLTLGVVGTAMVGWTRSLEGVYYPTGHASAGDVIATTGPPGPGESEWRVFVDPPGTRYRSIWLAHASGGSAVHLSFVAPHIGDERRSRTKVVETPLMSTDQFRKQWPDETHWWGGE